MERGRSALNHPRLFVAITRESIVLYHFTWTLPQHDNNSDPKWFRSRWLSLNERSERVLVQSRTTLPSPPFSWVGTWSWSRSCLSLHGHPCLLSSRDTLQYQWRHSTPRYKVLLVLWLVFKHPHVRGHRPIYGRSTFVITCPGAENRSLPKISPKLHNY